MANTTEQPPNEMRALPAPDIARDKCGGCRRPIVWAVTVAGPNGPGGKLMPLDAFEDLNGRIAVTQPFARGRLLARTLFKDELVDRPVEYLAIHHNGTCPTHTKLEVPTNVIDLASQRTKRRGGRR